MPRIFGGHTSLGSEINNVAQKTAQTNLSRARQKRGILRESYQGLYIFYIDLFDSKGKIDKRVGPIHLVGSPEDLAMRYGSPSEMENLWEVTISYNGPSVTNGKAQITRRVGSTVGSQISQSEQANQVPLKGAAYAPPGPGMI